MTEPITYDAQSFLIGGERVFLTAGAFHYPRVPRELWADRIQKAKAAGCRHQQALESASRAFLIDALPFPNREGSAQSAGGRSECAGVG